MRTYSLGRRGLRGLGVALAQDLYQIMVDIDVRIDFELFKVKVSLIFLAQRFSLQGEGR
jgi:hypothetical protein